MPSEKIHWVIGHIFIGKSQISLNPGNSVQNLSKNIFPGLSQIKNRIFIFEPCIFIV